MMDMKRFENQIVLVPGGTQGIDKDTTVRLANERGNVIIADIDKDIFVLSEQSFKNMGVALTSYMIDINDKQSVKTPADNIVQDFGTLDIVVNSAEVVGPNGKKIVNTSLNYFDST
ncbi:MAG: SDR family NAD(P)-dependent oxidoreductase [Flavobacteriaceae bacterium]